MSIRFECRCGKQLKAREESAGRRTRCPQCGGPVGIPALTPTHRGATELPGSSRPAWFQNRRTHNESVETIPLSTLGRINAAPKAAATIASQLESSPQLPKDAVTNGGECSPDGEVIQRRRLPRWVKLCESRMLPRRRWEASPPNPALVFAGLASLFTICVAIVLNLIPGGMQNGWLPAPRGPVLLAAVVLLIWAAGYYCACAGDVLTHAIRGKKQTYQFTCGLFGALRSLGDWTLSFLAGPVVPVAVLLWYWLDCGRLGLLDAFLMGELAFVAAAYWLAALIAYHQQRNLRSLHPANVSGVIQRLGWWTAAGAVLFVVGLLGLSLMLSRAAALIHGGEASGYLLLAVCSTAAPLLPAGVLYWLGTMHRRNALRRIEGADAGAAAACAK